MSDKTLEEIIREGAKQWSKHFGFSEDTAYKILKSEYKTKIFLTAIGMYREEKDE